MGIPVQRYARIAGALLLISLIAGFFGEMYVPSKIIVAGNAAATVRNVREFNALFRFGFAAYLLEAVCDVSLSLLFYALLRPVQKDVALLAAFFGLMSTALFAVAEFFYFAGPILVGNTDERLVLLSLRAYGYGGGLFMLFYGLAAILRGWLMYRSNYFPKILGILLVLAGLGFVARNFAQVLAPPYASGILLLPTFVAGICIAVWFLVRGVDEPRWEERLRGA